MIFKLILYLLSGSGSVVVCGFGVVNCCFFAIILGGFVGFCVVVEVVVVVEAIVGCKLISSSLPLRFTI